MCEGILEERGLPKLGSSSGSSSSSSSSASSNSTSSNSTSSSSQSNAVTFTPFIPSAEGNKNVYHTKHTGGIVFIAVGGCLGFILGIVVVAWALFGISAWRSARKEYKLKEMEEKCQYDPFFFSTFKETSDTSDSDGSTDMSEKVLKNKPSTLSLYSLGSTSVLNLLNQNKNDTGNTEQTAPQSNNRRSMFISPTEILQNDANKSTIWANDSPRTLNLFDSPSSTQFEQSCTQVINNMEGLMGQSRPNLYQHNRRSGSAIDVLTGSGTPSSLEDTVHTGDSAKAKKQYRPPSMVLDQLLDQD